MKRILLSFLVLIISFSGLKAAVGDTTWVQAQSDVWLSYYGDYDSTITLPNGNTNYRKIYMIFTLGKYVCPGSPQYCSDWDYTVQNLLMTPGGDTVELGRLITPYANSARMTASWKGTYMFDVTDYYPILKNNVTMRIHYSGYSGGFTGNIKFAFIEGTPPRNVLGLKTVNRKSYSYGGTTDINTQLGTASLTAPTGTVSAESKMTVTGHGSDPNYCCEFYPNTYSINVNGNQIAQQNFWRDNCGLNNYYPQNGTWIYERGGWCPGDLVHTYSHVLTGVTANSNFTYNASFPTYSSTGAGSYTIQNEVVYYGGFNKVLDASLDDILAPTDDQAHYRLNPHTGGPIIHVKNTGSTTITSLQIEYGMAGYMSQYTWNGTLNSLEETDITLPEIYVLRTATGNTNTFIANILQVNGQADNDPSNNHLTSNFVAAAVWPPNFRITFVTNSSASGGYSESSWKIYDANNNVVAQRVNNAINTTYNDTLLLGPSVYRLEVTDLGCDGLSWWANSSAGNGSITVRKLTSLLPLSLTGYFSGDFGCGFTQYFMTAWPTGVGNITTANTQTALDVYPNPAQKSVTINISGLDKVDGTIQLIDAVGKTVLTQDCKAFSNQLNISGFANGLYTVVFSDNHGKIQTRLIIAK